MTIEVKKARLMTKKDLIKSINDMVESKKINYIPEYPDLVFSEQNIIRVRVLNSYKKRVLLDIFHIVKELDNKTIYINNVIQLAKNKNVSYFPDMELDFNNTSMSDFQTYSLDDLRYIYTSLDELGEAGFEDHLDLVNPLEVLEKYKNGDIEQVNAESLSIEETWRQHVPGFVKKLLPTWRKMPLSIFYEECKNLMNLNISNYSKQMRDYVCDLSELVFSLGDQENEGQKDDDSLVILDEISESIMKTVEMIILPHQEVIERIEKRGGQIMFSNVWNQPFSDSLKDRVKERDAWQCIVCEGDKGLHVHHKIPRKYGGVNHMDNLVTLCDSCHPAIETADIKKAFEKCLWNYKKNKASVIMNQQLSQDKSLLRNEVEEILDKVLARLNSKDETELFEDILGVTKRLEVIFYE